MVSTPLLQRRILRFTVPLLIAFVLLLLLVTLTSQAANTIDWQSASTGLPTSNIVRDVVFGDVNNDGKPDFIGVGNVGVVVYGGNGAGVWSSGALTMGLPTGGIYAPCGRRRSQ